jgi:hypothetical protein
VSQSRPKTINFVVPISASAEEGLLARIPMGDREDEAKKKEHTEYQRHHQPGNCLDGVIYQPTDHNSSR